MGKPIKTVLDLIALLNRLPLSHEIAVEVGEEFRPIKTVRQSNPKGLIIMEVE